LLQHPTIDRLRELGLEGMAKSLRELSANPESKALDHMEWLGILLEHEMTLRQQKRFEARARTAKLRHLASVEDIDYRAARGLDRALFLKLAGCDWIRAASASRGWLAPSATRRAGRISRCSTSVSRGCLPRWHWDAVTVATPS
jgi:DNA replication protein DnaC